MTGHSCRNVIPVKYERLLQWEQKISKATCECRIQFQLFKGAQDVVTTLTAVCCMLLPHNPYRLPQHYKRHLCGPSCSCKHQFLWIYLIFEQKFCLNCMGTVCHWQSFSSTTRVHFTGQCWYFKPQWTQVQAIIKASSARTLLVSWVNCAVTKCLCIYQYLWRGLQGGGSILAPDWKPDLQGFCSLASHSSLLKRSQQNSSKLQHTVCDVFRSHLAI